MRGKHFLVAGPDPLSLSLSVSVSLSLSLSLSLSHTHTHTHTHAWWGLSLFHSFSKYKMFTACQAVAWGPQHWTRLMPRTHPA